MTGKERIDVEAQTRREKILNALHENKEPLTGGDLAKKFSVSRQIIVQDIALLRAKGEGILATPQGYILTKKLKEDVITATLACQHTPAEMEEELSVIVRMGGRVLDVIVEHPIYGELKGVLMISSLKDVSRFIDDVKNTSAKPLSALTQGVHLHTIETSDSSTLEDIKESLKKLGYLVEE